MTLSIKNTAGALCLRRLNPHRGDGSVSKGRVLFRERSQVVRVGVDNSGVARLVSALVLSRLDYCNAVYIDAITAGSSCHGSCVSHPVRLALVADQAEDRAQGVPHWSYISDLLLSERQAAAISSCHG